MTMLDFDAQMSPTLVARSEDVLLACVAYNRPEMHTFDAVIRLRSRGDLNATTAHKHRASIASLPTEVLLRIREHLQTSLRQQVAREAKTALTQYEAALVEGLCSDCFWWNTDVYGNDVWAWVEAGYRGACACVVGASRTNSRLLGGAASDPRVPSESKRAVEELYGGLQIGNRAQWLRAYIARAHCAGERAWTYADRVLEGEFGCKHEVQGKRHHRRYQSSLSLTPSPEGTQSQSQGQALSREATAAATATGLKKASQGFVPGGFGSLVCVKPAEERTARGEEPRITLARLQRELDIPASNEEPSIVAEPST